jgi:hypothetical protein
MCRKSTIAVSTRSAAHGGTARRVISKLTRVPVQANAGLFRGCVLTNSHSIRRSGIAATTFARSTPCSGPGLNSSTTPESDLTAFGVSHQPAMPASVAIASYTVAEGAAIHT